MQTHFTDFEKMLLGLLTPVYKVIAQRFRRKEFTLLDVGCGDRSPEIVRNRFPHCNYYGIDKCLINPKENSDKNAFFQIDLENDSLQALPDAFFDAIIISHVIEHLSNGLTVIERLVPKLAKGGIIYIEFPSVKSLNFPSMHGTLNFCDDVTHKKLYDIKEIANILLSKNLKIVRAGTRRDILRIGVSPLLYFYCRMRRIPYAGAFWDILGFAEFVLAQNDG